ncbi:P-loop containing nucleoside triphosphate hydrolase protein, partial [Tricholoma matsutake]
MPAQSKQIKHMMLESDEQVQREVEERTGTRPCIWQIKVVCKVLEGNNIITITATGSGKTFTYWMVLLYVKHSIVLLVTPLRLLGTQFVDVLTRNHLKAVSMMAANATNALFKEVAARIYQLIIVSPELLLNDKRFKLLWAKKQFTDKIVNFVLDEAHVVKKWGGTF